MSRTTLAPVLAVLALSVPSAAQSAQPASAPKLAVIEPTKVLQASITTTQVALPILDGAMIAAVDEGAMDVKVLDAATLAPKFTLKGHTAKVTSISASFDGKTLASASEDKTVRIWSLAEGKELAKRTFAAAVPAVQFVGNDRLATAVGITIELWNPATPEAKPTHTLSGSKAVITKIAASRDGKHIVGAGPDIIVCYWGGDDGQLKGTFSSHTGEITGLGIDDMGKKAVSSGKDGKVVVYDLEQKKELVKYSGFTSAASAASLSPDGKRVVAASGEKVLCLDAETLKEMYALAPFRTKALCASFTKDGTKIIASGDLDPAATDPAKKGSIKIYPAR